MKVVTVQEMKYLEAKIEATGTSLETLAERAGLGVAQEIHSILGNIQDIPILILIGSGNNGGDGLLAAHHLQLWGAKVTLYLCTPRDEKDLKLLAAETIGCILIRENQDTDQQLLKESLLSSEVVLDAILGSGTNRPLSGPLGKILASVQEISHAPDRPLLVALDLPTGLNANTGSADPLTFSADLTLTLGLPKLGQFTPQGSTHIGTWRNVEIGFSHDLTEPLPISVLDQDEIAPLLPTRHLDAHKGTFGRVLIVAGSRAYVGAAYLACMGAYRAGAGLVTLAAPESLFPIFAQKLTEVTHLPLPEGEPGMVAPEASRVLADHLGEYQAAVIGCGLGSHSSVLEFIQRLVLSKPLPIPIVLDADALNHLSQITNWWEYLEGSAILTPHPGEMSRLMDKPTQYIQAHRKDVSVQASKLWNTTLILKGAFSLVSSPRGAIAISPFANPGLASGGTGDVLAGIAGALLAQGIDEFEAAKCAVYLHGAAAEELRHDMGDTGTIASDLLSVLPRVTQALRYN